MCQSAEIRVNYLGLMRSVVSWARIGRELCRNLSSLCDLSITEQRGHLYDPHFILPFELQPCIGKKRCMENEIAFIYPLSYYRMEAEFKAGGMVYETSYLPEKWVENINHYLDLLWVPNQFNREICLRSGVTVPMTVAPYGVDRTFFTPCEQKCSGIFTFLCIAMPQKRKGISELITAFYMAFPEEKNVRLVIKMPYRRQIYPFEYPEGELEKLVKDSRVELIVSRMDDYEIRDLYWNADCYVQPSYSEGFGMTVLEAFSCGLPVIATAAGGMGEFLSEDNCYLVPCEEISADEIQYDNNNALSKIWKPDVKMLSERLSEAFCGTGKKEKIEKSAEILDNYCWSKTAEIILKEIKLQNDAV